MHVTIPIINLSWHGGTRVLVDIANHLAAGGHEVVIVVARQRASTPFALRREVRVRHIGIHTGLKYLDYLAFLMLLPFVVRRGSRLLATFFVTYYPVRLAASLRGMRYAYLVQDIEAKYRGAFSGVLNFVCRLTYRDPRIIAANTHLRERLLAEYGRSSVSIDIGPSEAFFTEPVREAKRYDVIYFLRRESWKGLDRFQRFIALAAGRLTCLCVSQDESLFELVERAGVTCRKPANDSELIRCIDSARVLFLTSYHEGFALPPLECMARGVPAVLYRCGGPDLYVVDGRNSFYVDSEQQALQTTERLIKDPELYARTSGEATSSARAHRMDVAMRELTEHLQRLSAA